jgi:hypothetical protein
MRTSLAGRSGPAGLGSRLLLALALVACGGGGDGEKAATAADSSAVTSATAAASSAPAAADTCTGPPPAFSQAVLNGPWQALMDSLAAHAVSFPDVGGNDDTTTVKLCPSCDAVPVEIRSSNLTPCLAPSDLTGAGRRITGLFIVLAAFPAQHGWDALSPGDSLLAFTNSVNGPATLVYNQGGSGKPSPSRAWMFYYCQDGHLNPKTPQARWRPRIPPSPQPPTGGDHGDDGDEDGDGGTYGWMACVSGCCQFYTPPPNPIMTETPDNASPRAPDVVGQGQNQGAGVKPTWCRTT